MKQIKKGKNENLLYNFHIWFFLFNVILKTLKTCNFFQIVSSPPPLHHPTSRKKILDPHQCHVLFCFYCEVRFTLKKVLRSLDLWNFGRGLRWCTCLGVCTHFTLLSTPATVHQSPLYLLSLSPQMYMTFEPPFKMTAKVIIITGTREAPCLWGG